MSKHGLKHILCSIHSKPQHEKEALQYKWIFMFNGTTFTNKVISMSQLNG